MREEDNIEKDDLLQDDQDDSQDDFYDGLDDFVEYDDLTSLEGLPQLDELDKADDLSAIPGIAASINMDDLKANKAGDDELDIPLPDIGIYDNQTVSEMPEGDIERTVFPQLKPEENNAGAVDKKEINNKTDVPPMADDMIPVPEETVKTEPDDDIIPIPEAALETEPSTEDIVSIPEEPVVAEPSAEDTISIPEEPLEPEPSVEDIVSIPDEPLEPEPSAEDIVSMPEEPVVAEPSVEDTISIPEEPLEPESSDEDIISIPDEPVEPEPPDEDIMSIPDEPVEAEASVDDAISAPEEPLQPEPASEDTISIPEEPLEPEPSAEDIMSVPQGEAEPSDDIMSILGGDDTAGQDSGSENMDDMLGGLLDDLDTNGSITGAASDTPENASGENTDQADGIEDLLGMLSTDSDSEDIMSLDDATDEAIPDINDIPDISVDDPGVGDIADILPTENKEKASGKKKPGFFKRIFGNVVTDEIAEAEKQAKEDEAAKLEEAEKQKEEKALEKAQKKEEKEKLKAEKAEEKAANKAKKAEEKAAKKAEKLARKEQEAAEAAQEVVGKLNKVGVAIVIVMGVVFLVATVVVTNSFGNSLDKKKAKNYFDMSRYSQAYEAAVGTNMKKKDPEQYQRIVTLMKVQSSLDAYQNYENVKRYPEALDALLMGLRKYDANKKDAYDLEIEDKLEDIYAKMLDILSEEFGLSKSKAYDILSLSGNDYTKKVNAIANK